MLSRIPFRRSSAASILTVVCAALAGSTLLMQSASVRELLAFETLGVRWPGRQASFRINPNFPDASVAGSPAQQIEFIRCAAQAWRDQSRADFQFIYEGTTTRTGVNLNDGINGVAWADADDNVALAVTNIGTNRQGQLAFDIIFFARTGGVTNDWSGPGEPGQGTFDITGVATHELGHALGLGHEEDFPAATMFPAIFGRGLPARTLHADDQAGVESLYGTRTAQALGVEVLTATPNFGATAGGNEVVIEGVNFTYDSETTLRIGGLSVSTNRWDVETCGRIRIFNMPPHSAGAVDITVTDSIGTATLRNGYSYGGPPPRLAGIDPAEGPVSGGILMTVTGENLAPDASVNIAGRQLVDQVFVDTQTITGILPAATAAGPVDVELQQGVDHFVLDGAFTYNAYLLKIANVPAVPGQLAVPLDVLVTSPDPLTSVSFGFRYDPAVVQVRRITRDGTVAETPEFAAANIDNAAGVTTYGLVMTFGGIEPFIPAGDDTVVSHILCDIAEGAVAGQSVPLQIENNLGAPPIELIFTKVGESTPLRPLTVDGRISFIQGQVFIRGDANGDGHLDLSDATYALNNLFLGGPPPRPCADAADANDSGTRDVSDAIYFLNFLFLGGLRPPPPFPFAGPDPTSDPIEC